MEIAVSVHDLRKKYGSFEVLRGISFDVNKGEIFGILGANGAGKSTTLECIEGIKSYCGGSIEVFGKNITREKEVLNLIGVQLQSSSLQKNITVAEAMKFFCSWKNIDLRWDLLDTFGLNKLYKKQYGQLSVGQKRRLHLALALCNNPEIIILDEPTAGLDVQGRMELHSEIKKLKDKGVTVLLASHDMAEIEMLCDRLTVIVKGEVKFIGTVKEFKLQGQKEKKVKIKTANNSLVGEEFTHSKIESIVGDELLLTITDLTKSMEEMITKVLAKNDIIEDLTIESLSLEERFMEMVYTEGSVELSERVHV